MLPEASKICSFLKKEPKNFHSFALRSVSHSIQRPRRFVQMNESLFASFSEEKEGLA
jgi:hypothetical protein